MPFPSNVDATKGHYSRQIAWGDVYWFHFGAVGSHQYTFAGPHPSVLVSDIAHLMAGTAVIVPLTSVQNAVGGYRYHVPVAKVECPGLDNDSVAKVDQLYCVDRADLIDEYYIGTLD